MNKVDLVSSSEVDATLQGLGAHKAWTVSLNTGEGTHSFLQSFGKALQERYHVLQEEGWDNEPLITHARQRVHLENASRFLQAFLDTPPEDIVLGAEELRYAAQAVGRISGLIDVEDVLDTLFRDFCIGK